MCENLKQKGIFPQVTKGSNDEINVTLLMEACVGFPGQDPSKFVIFSENHDISSNQVTATRFWSAFFKMIVLPT